MSVRLPLRRAAAVAAVLVLFVSLAAGAGPEARKANYDLASRWTPAKVGKLVFDMSVTPHWLSTGDRFWYSYETSQGRRWFIVDPVTKSKKPLFDNAKMAAQLTRILLAPYDAQHLPIKTIKFIAKDTVIQFEIEVPKDNDILVNGKIVKASEIAKNLKGHLLITTGDIDNNVHPANTLRLAAALIRAGKRFDFFIFPGQRHGYGDMSDYWFWVRADYFCKWLLGDFSQTVDLIELQREKEQKGGK